MNIELSNISGSGKLWVDIVGIICGDTSDKSMIDIMCHHAPYTSLLGFKERTYVDITNRPLDNIDEQQFFVVSDVIEYLTDHSNNNFDVAICSDGIEHLTIETGYKMLSLMDEISDKQIIFTPLGKYMVTEDLNDKSPDSHRSGWTPNMLPNYLSIVFPNFHPSLNSGAWFGVNCNEQEKIRIYNQIITLYGQN